MQKLLKILLATAFVLGMASTIVASAHPMHHTDLMRDGHSQRALPVLVVNPIRLAYSSESGDD